MLKDKHVILGITGGIAAYKSVQLLRLLRKAGAEVQVIMTPAAKEFITPVTLSSLSGKPVIGEFFTANTGEWHSHVDLGLWADVMVVAPCTASTLAKMATGVADNMLVTTYLSAKEKVFVAPAMDLDMFAHPTTQRNLKTLEQDGVGIIMPQAGELASGLVGKGRMEEPEVICQALDEYFERQSAQAAEPEPLNGKKVLITAGPTYENLDPVRFIGNYSSGKMGFALAATAARLGAEVCLVAGPVQQPTPEGVRREDVTSAREMLAVCEREFEGADIAIMCAAVADYRPETCADSKLKREKRETMEVRLVSNPDIAATLGAVKRPDQTLVGFALETDNELQNAIGKARRKNLDWIVLNSMRDPQAGFGKDTNRVTIIRTEPEQVIECEPKLKALVADEIFATILND